MTIIALGSDGVEHEDGSVSWLTEHAVMRVCQRLQGDGYIAEVATPQEVIQAANRWLADHPVPRSVIQ